MPRTPHASPHAQAIRKNTFVAFQQRLKARAAQGDLVPLHLGDVFWLPPAAARGVDLSQPSHHRYGPVNGDLDLRQAAAADFSRLGLAGEVTGDLLDRTSITAGSTGGLDLALNASLSPGDEVLVITPSWPLIFGLLQRRGAVPVEVDVDPAGWLPEDPEPLRQALAAAITPGTAGIYFCDPNNPAGFVYSDAHLGALADAAREHDLWLYVDAVYADLHFGVDRPQPFAWLGPELQERAFVLTSYSKTLGLAGQRIGSLVAPPALAALLPRLCTHSTYHAARLGQRMAQAALTSPDAAQDRAEHLEATARGMGLVRQHFGAGLSGEVPHTPAIAGGFTLLDLRAKAPDDEAALELLSACLDVGVSLTPGSAFGLNYGRFARLCFTSTPPEQLAEGLERLLPVLG